MYTYYFVYKKKDNEI